MSVFIRESNPRSMNIDRCTESFYCLSAKYIITKNYPAKFILFITMQTYIIIVDKRNRGTGLFCLNDKKRRIIVERGIVTMIQKTWINCALC